MLSSEGKSPIVKVFWTEWVAALAERGTPKSIPRQQRRLRLLGMPVGGLGAGQVYLSGDGKLWWWDIFNTRASGWPNDQFNAYVRPYHVNDPADDHQYVLEQGFGLKVTQTERPSPKSGQSGFPDIAFSRPVPIGTVEYQDPELPVDVRLEAFSPFIPPNVPDSTLPPRSCASRDQHSHAPVKGDLPAGWRTSSASRAGECSAGRRTGSNARPDATHAGFLHSRLPAARPVAQPQIRLSLTTSRRHLREMDRGRPGVRHPAAKKGEIHHVQAVQGQLAAVPSGLVPGQFATPHGQIDEPGVYN